jgi:signal transduction histidine kinase/Tfp pilus assembly protein PilF
MKKIISLLLFLSACLFSLQSFSQQSKIDSLLQVLKTAKEDTGKANTLNALGREYNLVNEFDLSRKYSREALKLSEKIDYTKGKTMAFLNTGSSYHSQGDYKTALGKYDTALSLSRNLSDKSIIGSCYNSIGNIYRVQGKVSEAMTYCLTGLKNFKEAGDKQGVAKSNTNIGNIYYEQGNFPEALQYYFSNLKVAEEAGDKKSMATAYSNIGMVYHQQNDLSTSMKNYEKAVKLYKESGDKKGLGGCYSNMANNYYKRDSVDKALEYNQRAYKIFEEIGDKAWGAYIRNTMAQIKADKGDFKQALDDYYSSLKVFGEIGDTFNLFTSYQGIAGVYYKQGLYNETVTNLHNALFMAKKTNGANNISSCYENLAVMYDTLKDYKNALANYKLFVGLSDSLFNEKKSQQIAELNTKYETEKKDKDIALLNKDKEIREAEIKKQKLQKYSFIGGLGLVIVLLLFGYRAYRTQQSLRLQSIRNKISGDLHDDIGSTLNSISVYSEVARKKDEQQDEALEMIGEASRKIIEAMSDIVWTINPENDSFEKIIFRMKSLAYNLFKAKKIEFTFHADEILNEKKLSLEERRNFYLIFKEAINNLVKYSNAARVAITLTNENDTIKLSIKDDGVGFEMADDTTGNGLKNMKRRAMEMKAQFNIESGKGNGTQIELTLKA